MPLAATGLALLGSLRASRWMRAANREMNFGRICVRGAELRTDFKEQVRTPWILERRHGPARGIYNRLVSDGRFPGKQFPSGVQWCLNAL